jgi:hypothetical protein
VLGAQNRLTTVDEIIATAVRVTGASLPSVCVVSYVVALVLLGWSFWLIGVGLYRHTWTSVALLAAFTLRHAIARSGTNTLEGYFHPRVLAFALGAAAIALFLRRRMAGPLVLLVAAFALHPTTALWLIVWLTASAAIVYPSLRRYLAILAAAAVIAAVWALTAGPLAGRLSIMDPEWRQMLASKDYLFPLEWPAYAWMINLGYLPVIAWIYRRRSRSGLVDAPERALVLGSSALAAVFGCALVLHAIGVTLAIQLQPARLFWMFDTLAIIYAVWLIAEGGRGTFLKGPQLTATLVICFSIVRGAYVMTESGRTAVQVSLRDDDWGKVMGFARTTEKDSGWLAHPLHAVLYGTSVRVAGERDVFVEAVKDAAIGMYDRDIAVRTTRRLAAVPDFTKLTASEAQRLGAEFHLNFIVTEEPLDLPLAFESGAIRVYRLE